MRYLGTVNTRPRITRHVAESRILFRPEERSHLKILLSLAEAVVESGAIQNPLEYYKEIANQASPWVALPDPVVDPGLRISHVASGDVRNVTAALAVSSQGVRSERGEIIHLIFLISAPAGSIPASLSLVAQIVQLLRSREDRKTLLQAKSPEEVLQVLRQFEERSQSTGIEEEPGRPPSYDPPQPRANNRKSQVL